MSPTPKTLLTDAGLTAVEAAMRRAVAGTESAAGHIAVEHLATGGKRLRARLALAAVDALGGARDAGVGWAAACELLHNATLIHDDLQDGDQQRRGHPTVWARHGAAQAINVGDLMLVLPYAVLAEVAVSDIVRWRLCYALSTRTAAVVRGQADEQELLAKDHVSWADYEQSVIGKTSALFELPVLGAALIAGYEQDQATALATPFRHLGVLFQMQDDVLDLYGDKGRGLVGSDLYEGKVSCLVVEHTNLHRDESAALYALLRTPRATTPAADVERFVARFRDGGALAAVAARMQVLRHLIEEHPALVETPQLVAVTRELVATMLAPIQNALA